MQSLRSLSWSTLLMLVGTVLFVTAKWSDLHLPFYWDELGVYGPGVLYMVDHGVGMLPSALPPDLSRGHPLFFYFLFAAYTKVVGFSLVKIHLLALAITLWVALTSWWIGRKTLHPWAGTLAGISVLAMPFMFAQAQLVLPEMLLGGLMLWGLFSFQQGRWSAYFIWATLAVLTKESALVLVLACLTHSLWFGVGERWKRSLISLSPLIGFGLFLLVQRWQNGWFFFPFHTQFISFSWAELQYKAGLLGDFLFVYQGRWAMSAALGLGLLAFFWRKRTLSLRAIHPWFQLSGIFLLGMVAFTLINVYMDRYLLSLLPLLALGMGASLRELQLLGKVWLYLGVLIALVPIAFLPYHRSETFRYDTDINYRDLLEVQQAASTYLERNVPPGDTIYANFPIYFSLQDPRYGFISDSVAFTATPNPRARVSYIANMQPGVFWTGEALNLQQIVWQRNQGYSSCEVYQIR